MISNNCKDNGAGKDYTKFDTNSSVFYYNVTTKQSNVSHLTSAEQARKDCMIYAGTLKDSSVDTSLITRKPSAAVALDYSLTYTSGSKDYGGEKDNILYNFVSESSPKIKGEGVIFKINETAEITIIDGNTGYSLVLVDNNGIIHLIGSGTVIIPAGSYMIESAQWDKEATIKSLSLVAKDTEEEKQKRIAAYNTAVTALPASIEYNASTLHLINAAVEAYGNLKEAEQAEVNYQALQNAINAYKTKGVEYVENLISNIGTVDANSGTAITSARVAYAELKAKYSDVTIGNLSVLEQAENDYVQYAVDGVKNMIDAIATPITLDSVIKLLNARQAYENLTSVQKPLITNYDSLVQYEAIYKALVDVKITIELIDEIGEVTSKSRPAINSAKVSFDKLTVEYQAQVTNKEKLEQAILDFEQFVALMHSMSFGNGLTDPNGFFTSTGNISNKSATYNGVEYKGGLKFESGGGSIEFTTEKENATLTLLSQKVVSINMNGKAVAPKSETSTTGGFILVYELTQAGTYTLSRADSTEIYLIVVEYSQ